MSNNSCHEQIEIVSDIEEFCNLKTEYEDLFNNSKDASIFQSFEFLVTCDGLITAIASSCASFGYSFERTGIYTSLYSLFEYRQTIYYNFNILKQG